MSVSDTLSAISDAKSLALFNMIGLDVEHGNVLKTTLALTRKQYYSRMSEMINAGLVIRKNGKHFLSSFGKIVYEAQMIIGKGIQNYWKLKAIDSIDSSSASPQLPTEEYNRLIAALIESDDIKYILLGYKNNDIDAAEKEVFKSQDLVLSAPAKVSSMQFDR